MDKLWPVHHENGTLGEAQVHHVARLVPFMSSISPTTFLVTGLFALAIASVTTRFLSGRDDPRSRSSRMVPYWTPLLGHVFESVYDSARLLRDCRDAVAPHGIFALRLAHTKHTVLTEPGLVKSAMLQRESALAFRPIAWIMMVKLFGVSSRLEKRYYEIWESLNTIITNCLMREPYLSQHMENVIDGLQQNIPNMISFTDRTMDQHPWERIAGCDLLSLEPPTVEISLLPLMKDMLGSVSIPAFMGRAYLENYPDILQDFWALDNGMGWLMSGLPGWLPIPSLTRAHTARNRIWTSTVDFHTALDVVEDGGTPSSKWNDMEDVSPIMRRRSQLYKENGFGPKDRAELSLIWALLTNANVSVFWMILHILATEGMLQRVREEMTLYVKVSPPSTIGTISTSPNLTIDHDGLSKHCPLFRACFYETLRIANQPWSVRIATKDLTISTDLEGSVPKRAYDIKTGEYVMMPHDLHMLDVRYFDDPLHFRPERFLKMEDDGSTTLDTGTMRPFGGGPSICKGRLFAEKECMALVAGVLMMYEIEPADLRGWVIPSQKKATAVSLPVGDTRVRVRRKKFEWDE